MKKLFTFVATLLVGASLSLAQAAQGTPATTGQTTSTPGQTSGAGSTAPSGTTAKGHKHHHKVHKNKKAADAATTPAPAAQPTPQK